MPFREISLYRRQPFGMRFLIAARVDAPLISAWSPRSALGALRGSAPSASQAWRRMPRILLERHAYDTVTVASSHSGYAASPPAQGPHRPSEFQR